MSARIVWAADFGADRPGGAQRTNSLLIERLRSAGMTTIELLPADARSFKPLPNDLFVLNNLKLFDEGWLERVLRRGRFVRFEHDYAFGKERFAPRLFSRSMLNLVMSPLHKRALEERFGIRIERCAYQPAPMPVGMGSGRARRLPKSVLWMGEIAPIKGLDQAVSYAATRLDLRFDFHGFGPGREVARLRRALASLPNARYLGALGREEALEAMRRHEYFLHLPSWVEPFGRAVVEAYLLGCRPIVNDRVGAFSYRWDWEDRADIARRLADSAERFVRLIRGCARRAR